LPAIRTAIAYPGATKSRTGLTIAMFSLIVFSLVMMATMNKNFTNLLLGDEANAGWDVRADAMSADPVPDFTGTLQAKGVDTSEFTATGVVHAPSMGISGLRQVGDEDPAWKEYQVRGMDAGFIDGSTLEFGQRAVGYESDAAIVEALRSQPDVAVIDVNAVPDGDIGEDADAFFLQGITGDDKTFEPIKVELVDPRDGAVHTVTIIGIIDEKIGSLSGLYANDTTVAGIYGAPAFTSYYVALSNSDDADAVAKSIESALLTSGVQGLSIADELEESQRQESGFLYIIEGFMALGLVVGIAAVGVISFRSVVERRQQIGVLRAIGFQRNSVATSFLIETTFLVGLGGFAGTVLGLVLARNLFTSDDVGSSEATFIIPWGILAVIILFTNAAALVTTWIPARQAGRIAPAEALRYE
jgi:putative ABC transport system permease protein